MLINNNKLNNNVCMNMLSLKIHLSSLESSKLSVMIEAKIITLSDVFLCVCVSHSVVSNSVIPWTVACQAPL